MMPLLITVTTGPSKLFRVNTVYLVVPGIDCQMPVRLNSVADFEKGSPWLSTIEANLRLRAVLCKVSWLLASTSR